MYVCMSVWLYFVRLQLGNVCIYCLQTFSIAPGHPGMVSDAKNISGSGAKNCYFCVLGPMYAKRVQPGCWETWPLQCYNRVARACGLQLACRWLADRQRPERGKGDGHVVGTGWKPSYTWYPSGMGNAVCLLWFLIRLCKISFHFGCSFRFCCF